MKKLMLGLMVIGLNFSPIEARENSFFDSVKDTSKNAFLATKEALMYVVSCLRESNSVKIQKAFEAKEAVLQMGKKLKIDIDGEVGLLQNVQALGFDKKNATKALDLVVGYYDAMYVVISRFNSLLAPWNKSEEMRIAAHELALCLQVCKLYKWYFESNKEALKGWELVERYAAVCSLDLNNQQEVVDLCKQLFDQREQYVFFKGVDELYSSIKWMKKQFLNHRFKQKYTSLYDQLYAIFPTLVLFAEAVKQSSPYKEESWEKDQENRKFSGRLFRKKS